MSFHSTKPAWECNHFRAGFPARLRQKTPAIHGQSAPALTVQKNLKMGTYYKYLIAAVNGSKVLAVSKTIHVATKGGQVGNNTKVTLNQKKKTLRVGKTIKLKATLQKGSLKVKIHRKVAYESDNPNVAIVSKGGKVKAVGKGTCYIYAYAQNGVFAKCRIKVK